MQDFLADGWSRSGGQRPFPALLHRRRLLNQLKIQPDSGSVHQHYAFVDQLLAGDFGVGELFEHIERANEPALGCIRN